MEKFGSLGDGSPYRLIHGSSGGARRSAEPMDKAGDADHHAGSHDGIDFHSLLIF
jgi:hypothetical protein